MAAADRSSGVEAARLLVRAGILLAPSDGPTALGWLRSAVERDPGAARAHAVRARLAAAHGDDGEAERAAARALEPPAPDDGCRAASGSRRR